jgi:hypothetical protein
MLAGTQVVLEAPVQGEINPEPEKKPGTSPTDANVPPDTQQ